VPIASLDILEERKICLALWGFEAGIIQPVVLVPVLTILLGFLVQRTACH